MKLEISDLKEIIKLAAHAVLLHGDVGTENGKPCNNRLRFNS